jgi:hypothetical protein
MSRNKFTSADDAAKFIKDGGSVAEAFPRRQSQPEYEFAMDSTSPIALPLMMRPSRAISALWPLRMCTWLATSRGLSHDAVSRGSSADGSCNKIRRRVA